MPTAAAVRVRHATRASSAQRASCSARRASPAATARPTPADDALAGLGGQPRAHALGDLDELVVGQAGDERDGRAALARRRAPAAPRPSSASASAVVERGLDDDRPRPASPRPNGSSRRTSSGPASSPLSSAGEHVAGQAPLGRVGDAAAQQLERDDRRALVQREAVDLGQAAGVLDRRDPGLRRAAAARPATGSTSARPARSPVVGRERLGVPARARRRASAPIAAICVVARAGGGTSGRPAASPRAVEDERGPADQPGERADDPVEAALGEHDALQALLRGDRPAQQRVLLVDQPRERLLGDRDERQLVRDLEQREAALARAPRRAPRARGRARSPTPNPRPASPWSARRST